MSAPEATGEFSRIVDLRQFDQAPTHIAASTAECAALARRFGLVRVEQLEADVACTAEGASVRVTGRVRAHIVQSCAVSAEDLPVTIDEPIAFRFVPSGTPLLATDEEGIEITAEDCDEIAFDQGCFDLGEAVAQSMALAIDPFATGPEADQVRASGLLGAENTSPFAALAALTKKED
ncbi:MAG TPA: YceD family protein [Novosphingobium sp.]|nr:YceD family protein [Novosphingobium sp.]HZV11287.1 YceD family protein [Novosphingobium sp.]